MNRLPCGDELKYRFVPPRPSRFWNGVMGFYRNRLIRRQHSVSEFSFEEIGRLKELLESDARILIAPNHSDHADGLTLFKLAEEVDTLFCYMATHQLFDGPLGVRYKLFPRCGIFPVDREGAALAALKAAKDVLVTMGHPLVVYPEGEIYHTNDRLTPLREGAAAMALTAQKALKDQAPVYIVPVALKYRYLRPGETVIRMREQLTKLERQFTWMARPDDPLPARIYRFASGLLALKEVEFLEKPGEGTVPERVDRLRDTLMERLEERHLGAIGTDELPERINAVHRRVIEILKDEATTEEEKASCRRDLDELFLVVQLFSYPGDYIEENPTVERIAETLIKFEQDLAGGGYLTPVSERSLTFRIGEPMNMRDYLGGKSREEVRRCTGDLFARLQRALDELGGGTPIAEVAGCPGKSK